MKSRENTIILRKTKHENAFSASKLPLSWCTPPKWWIPCGRAHKTTKWNMSVSVYILITLLYTMNSNLNWNIITNIFICMESIFVTNHFVISECVCVCVLFAFQLNLWIIWPNGIPWLTTKLIWLQYVILWMFYEPKTFCVAQTHIQCSIC